MREHRNNCPNWREEERKNEGRRGSRRREKGGREEGERQRKGERREVERKEGLLNYITIPKCEFLLDNVIVSPLLPFPSHPHGHYLASFSLGEDLAMVAILSSSSFPNSPIPSTGIQST